MRILAVLLMVFLLPMTQTSVFAAEKAGIGKFENLHKFSENRAGFSIKGKWGFIDEDGKTVVESVFHEIRDYHKGYASVKLVNKWGVINKKGHYVVNPTYDDMGVFSEDLVAVKVDGKWGYINVKDKMVIQPQFSEALSFSAGLAAVRIDSNWGYIDKEGRFAINPRFAGAGPFAEAGTFSEKMAPVKVGNSWGYINTKGDLKIKPQFQNALVFSDGLAAVQEDTLWGFISNDGLFETNPQYDNAVSYSDGLAAVQKDGVWGYINRKGIVDIPFQYQEAGAFSNGIARVVSGDKVMYITTSGKDAGIGVSAKMVTAAPVTVQAPKAAVTTKASTIASVPIPVVVPVVAPVASPALTSVVTPVQVPKQPLVAVSVPKTKAKTPLKSAPKQLMTTAPTADIEPLGTLWQNAIVPKHRAIISFMDADQNINTFRGTDAYFVYNDGTLGDGKTGYTNPDGTQVPLVIPAALSSLYTAENVMKTIPKDLLLKGGKSRVFSIAQAAGVVPQTFNLDQTFMGTTTLTGVPTGMLSTSFLTKDDDDGTTTALWMELTGRTEKDSAPISKLTAAGKMTRVKLDKDAKGKALPRPYYQYKFNADGSHVTAPALSMGIAHDMVAWDWDNDGYTDYVVSYVTNTAGEKDWKNMNVALVFVDGKSLYNASQGNGSVKFWVDATSEYTTGGDVVGGLTDVQPSNSVRMAIGDLDGDKQPEVALYFTKVCGPTGLPHNNTLRILKLAYPKKDPDTGKVTDSNPDWNWIITNDSGYGRWYLQYDSVALAIGDLDGDGRNELVVLHGNTAALYQPSSVYLDIFNLYNKPTCNSDGKNCKDAFTLDHPVSGSDNDPIAKTSKMPKDKKSNPVLQAEIADLDGDGTSELVWAGTQKDDSTKLNLNVRSWKKYAVPDASSTSVDKNGKNNPLYQKLGTAYSYDLSEKDYDKFTLDSTYIRYSMAVGRFVYPETNGTGSNVKMINQIGLVTTATGSNGMVGLHWGAFNWGCSGTSCSPQLTLLGSGTQANIAQGINVGPSIIAVDLDGDSMIIGQGIKINVTDSTETLFNIQAPPKHYDEFTYNGTKYAMDAFSTLEDYKATLNFESSKSHVQSTTDISQGKFDASAGVSYLNTNVHGNNVPPPYFSAGADFAFDFVNDTREDSKIEKSYELTADSNSDDSLLYRSNSHDLWRYPILYPTAVAMQTVKVVDEKTKAVTYVPTQSYIQFVVPQEISDTVQAWGGEVPWYNPRHNNLNLFSYPSKLEDILGYPQGAASKTVTDWWQNVNGRNLVKVANKTIGNLNNGELVFSLQSDSSNEDTKNFKGTIGGYLNLAPAIGKLEFDVDLSGDGSFGTDSVTTTDASSLMNITVSTPGVAEYKGQSKPHVTAVQQNFTVDGGIYTTDSGVYSLGFAVTKLKNARSGIWGSDSPYQMAADPALNLPRMYTMEDGKWTANSLIDRSTGLDVSNSHEVRGVQFSSAKNFEVTGRYNGQALPANTLVNATVRIYNYSFVATGQVTVTAKFQPCDVSDPPDVKKAVTIGELTINTIPGRESGKGDNWKDQTINWTTPAQPTYGYFHIVLTTPDVKIEENTGKAIISRDSSGNPSYGGGNLNTKNDQGYLLLGIYNPETTSTTAPKVAQKSSATNKMVGATAPGSSKASAPATVSTGKSLKFVADSLVVRPLKGRTLGDAANSFTAGQKLVVQTHIRFDDVNGGKTSGLTRVNVYLRDDYGTVSHKIVPLLFNGKDYIVRIPYTAPQVSGPVTLEIAAVSAALPAAIGSSESQNRLAKKVITVSQP